MSRVSGEENARRLELYEQGLSDVEIGKAVGYGRNTIKAWRLVRGLKSNKKTRTVDLQQLPACDEQKKRLARKKNMEALTLETQKAKELGLSYGQWRAIQEGK